MKYSDNHFRKQNVDLRAREQSRIFRSENSTEFLLAAYPRVTRCERALPYRLAKYDKAIKVEVLEPGGFDQKKVDKQFTSGSSALVKKPNKKHKAYNTC